MMKIPVSGCDVWFVIGLGLLGYGLYGWHWQIASAVVGVVIMLLSVWGALGERVNGNTSKDA
jgi:TctA family transporter